ncbi:type IV secretory system conjugative DNA transfer family protein [Brucella pituitosa]|uniref:type IV secretory system conjugative DNA transfer family protein n=1 Tax=Brucella pituitosa TaxID=571256 RepID=UPI0009A13885|nr:type IV secretory system conjugative DNA transfer family protein [Brucella pituitosa]
MHSLFHVVLITCCLTACARHDQDMPPLLPLIGGKEDLTSRQPPPVDYAGFVKQTQQRQANSAVATARAAVLREAAISYAAQAGYQRRVFEIMNCLEKNTRHLSEQFNFNAIVYPAPKQAGYIVPPVVSRTRQALTISQQGHESVAADDYYRIQKPGRIVAIIPTWRDYLVMPLDKPSEPDTQFLPKGKAERRIWERFLPLGWKAGSQQADEALALNLNLLARDYLGMIEYRRLVSAGIIRSLLLSTSQITATGTNNELFIGQRRIRIQSDASFAPRTPTKTRARSRARQRSSP